MQRICLLHVKTDTVIDKFLFMIICIFKIGTKFRPVPKLKIQSLLVKY